MKSTGHLLGIEVNVVLVKLYKYSEKIDFTELAYLGPVKASKNRFWKEVFDSWNSLKELHLPRYPGDVLSTSFQYSMDNSILKPAKFCVFCMLCTMNVNIFPLNIIFV
jgi:hypothetical protein